MLQWADGDSLRDYYKQTTRPNLDGQFIWEIVTQIWGPADAIHKLHNYQGKGVENVKIGSTESYRHGDLKPENILRFLDDTKTGAWKIAGMGLAKHHYAATHLRGLRDTSTRYGTRMYEPPEVVTRPAEARSRLCDIWPMGCITLELIISPGFYTATTPSAVSTRA